MASRIGVGRLAVASSRIPAARTASPVMALVWTRGYSSATDEPAPPLLAKLKGDLKAAMKAKDKARLTVLRSVMATALNASKTAQPINTDAKVVALLRKTAQSSQEAAAEFREAGRADLADKEEEQVRILEAYAADSGLATLSTEELQAAVAGVLSEMESSSGGSKPKAGDVIKRLLAPGGPLDGKDVNKAEMARVVKTLTS